MDSRVAAVIMLLFLSLSVDAAGQTYYADLVIELDNAGYAAVSGNTNHPRLSVSGTGDWTSKKGSLWLLNITLPEEDIFSDYVYEADLPAGAEVNYVKTGGEFRITSMGDRISIRGFGENEAFYLLIQYRLAESTQEPAFPFEYLLYGIILLVSLIAAVFFFNLSRKKPGQPMEKREEARPADLSGLTDRQKEIYGFIKDAGKPINQSSICERLDLPKSSVSRNIDALERRGLISKTREGMSALVSIRKK